MAVVLTLGRWWGVGVWVGGVGWGDFVDVE
jgi:hypothetical protein